MAVADSPYGPFYDPLGKPLVQSEWGDIDPTVFIDDDGQAYLYWGNPNLYYVKLNEDMISYSGDIVRVPLVAESFGKREGDAREPLCMKKALGFINGIRNIIYSGREVRCPSISDTQPAILLQVRGNTVE